MTSRGRFFLISPSEFMTWERVSRTVENELTLEMARS